MRLSRKSRALWAAAALAAAAGCAKMGDPLPPVVQPPATVQDLRAETSPSGPRLLFSLPSNDIRWVEIYRQCDPKTAGDRINLIARLAWGELRESSQPGVFSWEDRGGPIRPSCRYALRFVNERGFQSEFSNFTPLP